MYNLVSHLDDLEEEDLFQYAATAALLTTYLERRTTFFQEQGGKEDPAEAVNEAGTLLDGLRLMGRNSGARKPTSEAGGVVEEDLLLFVGGLILRHVAQLVCNASAIFEVAVREESFAREDLLEAVDGFGLEDRQQGGDRRQPVVVGNEQVRIATALYPSASMMNHSCDPSVINSFWGSKLIVRAIKRITGTGQEVFNCYGPHFRRHGSRERQEALRAQYHFTCRCGPCSSPRKDLLDDFRERFSALRCAFCGGPIRNPRSEGSLDHELPCMDCGRHQEYKQQIEQVFLAYELFKRGAESLRYGSVNEALSALQSCYQLRTKAMYVHHLEVTEVADQLARCYALMGSFSESAQYLKLCLPAIEERSGRPPPFVSSADINEHEIS